MKIVSFTKAVFFILLLCFSISAQSTNVEFPTPITSDAISGKIKARDIGDSRSTVYYYVFEASQGDIFLKIEAANLNGDIDIFYADNLRPLTKISLYADSTPTQTGREIYLRKPEKLILRVEGRTPNDDPATYSIKFEGSFLAMAASEKNEEPKQPEVKEETESEVKVNSVGTIIEVKPKATPTPRRTVARNNRRRNAKTTTVPEPVSTIKTPKTKTEEVEPEKKTESVASETQTKSEETIKTEIPIESENTETPKEEVATEPEKPKTPAKKTTSRRKTPAKKEPVAKKAATPKPNPAAEIAKALENVQLVVEFKDGRKIERPMNDVVRFGVDKGFLTIVNKDGSIGRFSILEISKIAVQ
jgi:hypothetical protein